MHRRLLLAGAVAAACLTFASPALAGPSPSAPPFEAGASGFGDSFFPFAGNGGYDASHYDLALDYDYRTQVLDASVRITATATQKLRQFNLDLRGFEIERLTVQGRPAAFRREGEHELVITPLVPLITGHEFVVEVDYHGVPQTVVDPDTSFEGWVKTADGAFVVNEPQGSPGWFPVNDDPNDKATFDFAITVPEGKTALANGVLLSSVTDGGKTTWRWTMRDPISPYLTTATNGDFALTIDALPDGTPIYNAIAPGLNGGGLARQKEIHAVFSELFGPYPFDATGAIIDRGGVGYALETATKANYDTRSTPSEGTVVHEISHEWFGNAVTLANWHDIWLNEGFARFSQWIFTEKTGGTTAAAALRAQYNAAPEGNRLWALAPAAVPGPEVMFDGRIYTRGGMALQALRETIGEADFLTLMRDWYAEYRYGNASTEDFMAAAEEVSGEELDAFFDAWLFGTARPPLPGS